MMTTSWNLFASVSHKNFSCIMQHSMYEVKCRFLFGPLGVRHAYRMKTLKNDSDSNGILCAFECIYSPTFAKPSEFLLTKVKIPLLSQVKYVNLYLTQRSNVKKHIANRTSSIVCFLYVQQPFRNATRFTTTLSVGIGNVSRRHYLHCIHFIS